MFRNLEDISAIIVTYKGDGLLVPCLESIADTCGKELELVVVDNSPSGETEAIVKAYPNARYVKSDGNPGFAGGNNRGIGHCTRKYILLLNNDTIIRSRRSIEELALFLDGNPKAHVAQGTMLLPERGNNLGGCGTFLTPFGFMLSEGFNVPPSPRFDKPFPCFSAIGAFMMLRRTSVDAAGGFLFRTHFWSYYEESDFCHRVWLSGNEVWYVPTVPIDHICGVTSGRFSRTAIMARYLRNQFFSLAANLGLPGALFILPLFAGVIIGYGALHLLCGNREQLPANLNIFKELFEARRRIAAARRRTRRLRRISDIAIFARTMRIPSIAYLVRTFRG